MIAGYINKNKKDGEGGPDEAEGDQYGLYIRPKGPNGEDVVGVKEHVFHENSNEPGDGAIFECEGQYSQMGIQITIANASSFKISFVRSLDGVNYLPYPVNYYDSEGYVTSATYIETITGSSEVFDIIYFQGTKFFKVVIDELEGTGATVTALGVAAA